MSTIPTVKAAILTRLEADRSLAGVQISWGNPHPKKGRLELVIIGNATHEQEPAGIGTISYEESYALDLIISVVGPIQESQQTLETRAFEIVGLVESSINSWRSEASPFGGISGWIVPSAKSTSEVITPEGDVREAAVIIKLAVTARI